MLCRRYPFDQAGPVKNHAEWPLRRDRRVELFQRAGSGIPWISKLGQARFSSLRIELRETAFVQKSFTAYFQNIWRVPL
jgi:hypothetical protein